MSLVFNDLVNGKGLVQLYEEECGYNPGDVSGNTARLKRFTASANQALDDFTAIAITAGGTWQYDDSNHETDYPIITTNLVANQRDYAFTTDETGNLILDIYKVLVKGTTGVYYDLIPADQQSDPNAFLFTDGLNTTGSPTFYDKTANAIFLDCLPAQDIANGLKVFINRESSYFAYTDTTKMPGVPGVLHKYFYLKPALDYARRNTEANQAKVEAEVVKMEGDPIKGFTGTIARHYAHRIKDEKPNIVTRKIRFR